MIDYKATFINTDGVNFPNTKAINVTVPGAGDGTEFIAAGVNDSWGFHQALMDYGLNGVSPDTVTEAPGTSQMVEAMRLAFGHPGEVVGWHGQADPSSLSPPLRLLLLQGQGILRANYALLDTAVYCGDGNNPTWPFYYHADDAAGTSRNIAGIYLILADARGLILRGDDPTALRDPSGAGRDFPDIQLGAVWTHGHEINAQDNGNYTDKDNMTAPGGLNDVFWNSNPASTAGRLVAEEAIFGSSGAIFSPNENRMINLQTKWCVRY